MGIQVENAAIAALKKLSDDSVSKKCFNFGNEIKVQPEDWDQFADNFQLVLNEIIEKSVKLSIDEISRLGINLEGSLSKNTIDKLETLHKNYGLFGCFPTSGSNFIVMREMGQNLSFRNSERYYIHLKYPFLNFEQMDFFGMHVAKDFTVNSGIPMWKLQSIKDKVGDPNQIYYTFLLPGLGNCVFRNESSNSISKYMVFYTRLGNQYHRGESKVFKKPFKITKRLIELLSQNLFDLQNSKTTQLDQLLFDNEISKTLEKFADICREPATARIEIAVQFEPYKDGTSMPHLLNRGLTFLRTWLDVYSITPESSLELLRNDAILLQISKIFLPCVRTFKRFASLVFMETQAGVSNGSAWKLNSIHDMYVVEAIISAFIFGKLDPGWTVLIERSLDLHLLLFKDLGVQFKLKNVKFSKFLQLNTVPTANLSFLLLRQVFSDRGKNFKSFSCFLESLLKTKTIASLNQFQNFEKLSTTLTVEFVKLVCSVLGPSKEKKFIKGTKIPFKDWFQLLQDKKVCVPFLQTCIGTLEEVFKLKQDNSHYESLKFTELLITQWQSLVNLQKCNRLALEDAMIEFY